MNKDIQRSTRKMCDMYPQAPFSLVPSVKSLPLFSHVLYELFTIRKLASTFFQSSDISQYKPKINEGAELKNIRGLYVCITYFKSSKSIKKLFLKTIKIKYINIYIMEDINKGNADAKEAASVIYGQELSHNLWWP